MLDEYVLQIIIYILLLRHMEHSVVKNAGQVTDQPEMFTGGTILNNLYNYVGINI